MTNDIKGLDIFEDEATEWSKMAGDLKARAGIGMIDALESWYRQWLKKPTKQNRREYMTWRLRLHLKWNGEPEFLTELDEAFDIGLRNDEIGRTFWDIQPEFNAGITKGFNWRRDAGHAIKGEGTRRRQRKPQPNLEEQDVG